MPNEPPAGSTLAAAAGLAAGERLYGIVDGARDLALAHEARQAFGQETRSLFRGRSADEIAHVAPYLTPIDPVAGFLDRWALRLGGSAGILLTSISDLVTLHEHCRKIFVIQDETGQEFFFRYYDPRVLRPYLPTCRPEELAEFFGPIARFLVEDEAGDELIVYRRGEEGLVVEHQPLTTSNAAAAV